MRFGFRLLYNEFAWTYDFVSWGVSLGNWRRWQRASIPHLNIRDNDLVLELAHGTGDLQLDLHDVGIATIGYDLSRKMGRIASRKIQRRGLRPTLVRGNAMQLPFANEAFAAIVSTFPTEFMVDQCTLREASRVLSPGGRLVFVPNGMLNLTGPATRLVEWLYKATGQRGSWPIDPLAAFEKAGFDAKMLIENLAQSQVWIIAADKIVSRAPCDPAISGGK